MTLTDLDEWAKKFAADLGTDGAWVPFDRLVVRHRLHLDEFIAHGLTYATLAKAIARAGGRRPDGTLYSDKQFNTAMRRAEQSARNAEALPPSEPPPKPMLRPAPNGARRTRRNRLSPRPEPSTATPVATDLRAPPSHPGFIRPSDHDKDLSDEDIRAALSRIRRTDP